MGFVVLEFAVGSDEILSTNRYVFFGKLHSIFTSDQKYDLIFSCPSCYITQLKSQIDWFCKKLMLSFFLLHCNLWLPFFPKIALNFCHFICPKNKVMTIAFLHIAFSLIAIEVWGYFRILNPSFNFFEKWKDKLSVW